jgi:hypothetical protein
MSTTIGKSTKTPTNGSTVAQASQPLPLSPLDSSLEIYVGDGEVEQLSVTQQQQSAEWIEGLVLRSSLLCRLIYI